MTDDQQQIWASAHGDKVEISRGFPFIVCVLAFYRVRVCILLYDILSR